MTADHTAGRPIFVAGCPRSGTTMLQLMLHAHPRIAIPPETRFVLSGYERRHEFGDLREQRNRQALADWILRSKGTQVRDLQLDIDEVARQIVSGHPTLGAAMATVFRAYSQRFGKPRWGDKRPSYINHVDIIRRLFPDAVIVNIVRDGRDCVGSLLEMPWHDGGIYKAIASWARAVDSGRRAAARLGPDSYYRISYERLVREPEKELRGLCDFLGEQFDPAMLQPQQVAGVAVPKRKTWHERTHDRVGSDRIGAWNGRLTPQQLGLCEAILGSRLVREGYPLSGAPTPSLSQRLRYQPYTRARRVDAVKRVAANAYYRVRGSEHLADPPSRSGPG